MYTLRKYLTVILAVVLGTTFLAGGYARATEMTTSEDRYKVAYIEAGGEVEDPVTHSTGTMIEEATGFIVKGGYIITNAHVVNRATGDTAFINAEVPVKNDMGFVSYTFPCTLVAIDVRKELAILKIDTGEAWSTENPYFEFDFDILEASEKYEVIGNPIGEKWVSFSGYYAGKYNVQRLTSRGWLEDVVVSQDVIKGSGEIGHGSSGSPVINSNGKVVSVVNSSSEGSLAVGCTPQEIKAFLEENDLYDEIILGEV
jgi:S1-C subfamily serine protease